jgi:L-arabinonolactonase
MTEIHCVVPAGAKLGEGTFWDGAAQVLWWIDIFGKTIYRYDPVTGGQVTYATPEEPGCLAPRAGGGLVLSMTSGFFFFDPASGKFEAIVDPESQIEATRFNDGRTDRQGRFWSGSMVIDAKAEPRKIAALYRLDRDLGCHRVVEGIGCSNGLAWSPDSRTMYYADSHTPLIRAWDFDPATGDAENPRTFVDLSEMNGIADGATVDEHGCYWVTIPFQGKVLRFDPAGALMRTITVPCDIPTCCEFGGRDLDVLYVTTAALNRAPAELAGQPLAGGLFAIDAGVRGLLAPPFQG